MSRLRGYVAAGEAANFPAFLISYLRVEETSYSNRCISFNYAGETGAFLFHLDRANDLLQSLKVLTGPARKAALKAATDYVAAVHADHEEAHRQWHAYIEAKHADRLVKAA